MGTDNLQFIMWEFIIHLQIIYLVILWKKIRILRGQRSELCGTFWGSFIQFYPVIILHPFEDDHQD